MTNVHIRSEFLISLSDKERVNLIKLEKEAVLRKMKMLLEQQKHTCSCTVCGRRRTAIEEELEMLYDAYYDELEKYAHAHATNTFLGNCEIQSLFLRNLR